MSLLLTGLGAVASGLPRQVLPEVAVASQGCGPSGSGRQSC